MGQRVFEGASLLPQILFEGSGEERVHEIPHMGFRALKVVLGDAPWPPRLRWREDVQHPCDHHSHTRHNGQAKDSQEESVVHVWALRSSATRGCEADIFQPDERRPAVDPNRLARVRHTMGLPPAFVVLSLCKGGRVRHSRADGWGLPSAQEDPPLGGAP